MCYSSKGEHFQVELSIDAWGSAAQRQPAYCLIGTMQPASIMTCHASASQSSRAEWTSSLPTTITWNRSLAD